MKKGIIWGLAFIIALCVLSNTAMAGEPWWQKYFYSGGNPIRCEHPWVDTYTAPSSNISRANVIIKNTGAENIKLSNMNLFAKVALQFGFINWCKIEILGLRDNGNEARSGLSIIR
jgi:hypothetical protein